MKSNLVDLEVRLHHETEKALLVSTSGDRDDAVWVPKSAVEFEGGLTRGTLTLPEALAIEKGLM